MGKMKILVLNGVNMNMLGKRNPQLYGTDTLAQLEEKISSHIESYGWQAECRQSNCEGVLVDILQQTDADGVVLNAGAYSHYSLALRDCIESLPFPVAEVHMTDISQREVFRHTDVLKEVCQGYFCGKGLQSYLDAVDFLVSEVKK